MGSDRVFSLRELCKVWKAQDGEFRLCVSKLEVGAGEQIAVLGESGCGKSTLLDILAMTLEPTSCGRFHFQPVAGERSDIDDAWRERRLDRLAGLRGRHVGYVLQTGGLLPFISVRENIVLPRRVCGLDDDGPLEVLAERLQIADQLDRLPATLSVGQRQRVAVARALVHEPAVILADEPTASLDPHTAGQVMELLVELATRHRITLVVASHDWERVTSLGLTRIHHEQSESGGVLRSEFHT
jgi:putative ABC transport system ATP-binding protein